jgi:hypothetical protein
VRGAKYSAQASVRCTAVQPGVGAVEFEVETDCGYLRSLRTSLTAVNIDCRTAAHIARVMPDACVGERVGQECDAAYYRCRVTEVVADATFGRCHSRRDPFYALRYYYVWPP